MIVSQELQNALNSKGYKTDKGKIKALKSLAKNSEVGLAREAQAVLNYEVEKQKEAAFTKYVTDAARLLGKRPYQLSRAQVKSIRQKFEDSQ